MNRNAIIQSVLWVVALVLALPKTNGQPLVREAFPTRAPTAPPGTSAHAPVPASAMMPDAFQEGVNVKHLGPVHLAEIEAADLRAKAHGSSRVGLVRPVTTAPLGSRRDSWLRRDLPDGRSLWTMAVRSPGAQGLRVNFSKFNLGVSAATVHGKTPLGLVVRGPYTGNGPTRKGHFWSESVPGDTAYIEVVGRNEPEIEVAKIVHFDRHPAMGGDPQPGVAPCQLDVMCEDSPSIIASVRDAVGQMNYVADDGDPRVCSGALLQDWDDVTRTPYFLTAYHCLHTQDEVDTLEVVWFWQTDQCGGNVPIYSTLPTSYGGTLLADSSTAQGSDMVFIRLNGPVPAGVTFAGWTTADLPDRTFGIHHPAGDFKRITFFDLDISVGICDVAATHYHTDLKAIRGMLEKGSSGSPLFNYSGQVLGQFSGWCSFDVECSNRDERRCFYGEFSRAYDIHLRPWLEGVSIYVDGAYQGSIQLGTETYPFSMVNMANLFAVVPSRIYIKAGNYPETLTLSKRLEIKAQGGVVTIGR